MKEELRTILSDQIKEKAVRQGNPMCVLTFTPPLKISESELKTSIQEFIMEEFGVDCMVLCYGNNSGQTIEPNEGQVRTFSKYVFQIQTLS